MKVFKRIVILTFLIVVLSAIAIGSTFSKYKSKMFISNINLNITPRPQYEMTASDHEVRFEKNTKSEITVSMIPGESIWERIYIPLDAPTVGLYQLSFDVVMETESTEGILEDGDGSLYVYGCTVGSNERLYWGDYVYMWTSVIPLEKEHVDLAFWATEEDVAAGKVPWVWNWSNIVDYCRSRIFLTNIKVEKIPEPSTTYIDFPYTQFVYGQYVQNSTDYYNYVDETIGLYRYHISKGTYIRQATYNEFAMSVECLGGHENINIPLRGLTIGKTYKLKFDYRWTSPSNYNDSPMGMACDVVENKFTKNESIRYSLAYYVYRYPSEVKNAEISFEATAETMYWFWQGGGIYDSEWFTMWLSNCTLSEVA